MRQDVTFKSEGVNCSGWLYLPDTGAQRGRPAIAMAHGLAAVREMYDLPAFAEIFAAAGIAVLLFDYRFWGSSDGEPRGQIFPVCQIEDYRCALTFLSEHPQVDASRLGVWGTSFSGGHVLHLGAYDPRVKCVVSQVPAVNIPATLRRNMPSESLAEFYDYIVMDRLRRHHTGESAVIPINAPAGESCLIPGEDAYRRMQRELGHVPGMSRQCTLSSLEAMMEYNPGSATPYISPTPLLMIIAERDELTPPDIARHAYDHALEPKSLLYLPCTHYDVYKRESPDMFERAALTAAHWFSEHL